MGYMNYSTYIYINEDVPGIRITVQAQSEEQAYLNLIDKLDDSTFWLDIDTQHPWQVTTMY